MGVYVQLEDEHGVPIRKLPDPSGGTFDAAGDFDNLLPEADPQYICWGFIDPYGDTVFNRPQMPRFLQELEDLLERAQSDVQRRGLLRTRVIGEMCRDGVHLYVRFIGD